MVVYSYWANEQLKSPGSKPVGVHAVPSRLQSRNLLNSIVSTMVIGAETCHNIRTSIALERKRLPSSHTTSPAPKRLRRPPPFLLQVHVPTGNSGL